MSETRGNLKNANKQVAGIKGQIEKLEAAVERAGAAAEQAEVEFAKYTDLGEEITEWRVQQVKRGATTKELPAKLKTAVDAKRAAEEELNQSAATCAALAEELVQLQKCLKPIEERRTQAAVEVLHEQGNILAAELAEVSARRSALVFLIRSLAHMPGVDGTPVGFTRPMFDAQNDAGTYEEIQKFLHLTSPLQDMAARWRTRLAALLSDPDAAVTIPRLVAPADYTYVPRQPQVGIMPQPPLYQLKPEN
jgi:hypothetical protein